MQHHDDAIARYVARVRDRPEVLGVLVTGSVSRGEERADSDVDLVLVVTEQAWAAAIAAHRVMVVETDAIGYEHGYFDVKLATAAMVQAVPTAGDDPVRDSLSTARCVFDRDGGIAVLVDEIRHSARRPDPELAASFVAQARLHGTYFLPEGLRREDPLLTAHAAVHLATAACRAALALAGVPYPGPKQALDAVRSLPGAREALVDAVLAVVADPNPRTAARVLDEMEAIAGATLPEQHSLSRFVLDNELAWFTGRAAPEYR